MSVNPKWFIFWARFNAVFLGYEVAGIFLDFHPWRILALLIFFIGMKINWEQYMMFPESERNK